MIKAIIYWVLNILNINHLWNFQTVMMQENVIKRHLHVVVQKNLVRLNRLSTYVYELAQLFGQPSYADWALKKRMAKTPK